MKKVVVLKDDLGDNATMKNRSVRDTVRDVHNDAGMTHSPFDGIKKNGSETKNRLLT